MNYYNEHDKKAATWLRELIREGHIPKGEVDERSITDVNPTDLNGFTQCHFFAGIGGWSLALKLAGWPDNKPVWTGSCPCQPFSVAGKGLGEADERHLWPEFKRLIAECNPPAVFGEQVASAAGRLWLSGVRIDLEKLGYAVGAADLCAAGISAPHIRQRLFWMADSSSERCERGERVGKAGAQGEPDGHPGECCESSNDLWLVHSIEQGLEGLAGNGNNGDEPRRHGQESHGPVAEAGTTGGLEESRSQSAGRELSRPGESAETAGERAPDQFGGSSSLGGLEHSESNGREQRRSEPSGRSVTSGCWGSFDLIPCRDGKTRRIESGTFPLAHGIPGRVGLLRGYGNAIVPALASEFIQAYQEATTSTAF